LFVFEWDVDYVTGNGVARETQAHPTSAAILQEPNARDRQHFSQLFVSGDSTMTANTEGAVLTKVYTTPDGCICIEQSPDSMVVVPADQILKIIKELHACYDYCAVWKETTP
jgi:hypothetical protein